MRCTHDDFYGCVVRTSRFISVLVAAMMLPVTWSLLDLSGATSSSAASALTPEQQMCSSPAADSTTVRSAGGADLASCALDVATTGTAHLTGSASVYPWSTAQQAPWVTGSIKVDGHDIEGDRTVALDLRTNDGADRNLSIQLGVPLSPGHHTFSFHFSLLFGSQAQILHPVINVLFVPTAGGVITACHQENNTGTNVAARDHKLLAQCTLHAPTSGTLRLSGSTGIYNVVDGSGAITADLILSNDGQPVSQTHVEGGTNDDPNLSPLSVAHQAAVRLAAGDHEVSFAVQVALDSSAFTVVNPSVQAIFTPDGTDDAASCIHSQDSPLSTSGTARVDTCSFTMPRAGRAQIQTATTLYLQHDYQGRTSDAYYKFWLVVDGIDQSSTGRYMDLRSESDDQMETVLTHLGLDLQPGPHTIELWTQHFSGTLTPSSVSKSSISAVALTQPADAPATTQPSTSTTTAPPTTLPGGDKPARHDFVPLVPERVLDTRGHDPIGYIGDKPVADQTITLRVTGVGASNVPSDAKAVVLNLTGTGAATDGYVTVWPCGSPQPTASNLNVTAGASVPNLVIAKIGDGGTVCLYTQPSQDLVADIAGYMPAESWYVPVVPDRVLETRAVDQRGYTGAKPAAGAVIELDVTGVGSSQLPDDTSAVVLNVTGTEASAAGYVTVWPCGAPQPTASNLNLTAGTARPNLVVSKVGDGGKVCLFTQSSAHLVADVNGYLPAGSAYVPIVPVRILETRPPAQVGYTGEKPAPGSVVRLHVVGQGAAPASATAVVLNVTGTEATTDGYVTVWPCDADQPTASNLNLTGGSTAPNLVMAKVGIAGDVCLYTQSGTHLVADLAGYWTN